jgi:hypothetical protein
MAYVKHVKAKIKSISTLEVLTHYKCSACQQKILGATPEIIELNFKTHTRLCHSPISKETWDKIGSLSEIIYDSLDDKNLEVTVSAIKEVYELVIELEKSSVT